MKTRKLRFVYALLLITNPLLWSNGSMAQTAVKHSFVYDSVSASSNDRAVTFEADVLKDGNHKFIVVVNNPRQEKLKITLRTPAGQKHFDYCDNMTLNKRFDLTGADSGEYTITVTNGKKSVSKHINFSTVTLLQSNLEVKVKE